MPRFHVVVNEHTNTTYEVEADTADDVYDMTFEGEETVSFDVVTWEITDVEEVAE